MGPPLKARVTFFETSYNMDDPGVNISAVITLENISGSIVWTNENFKDSDYYRYLRFKGPGPDGPIIKYTANTPVPSPTPSVPLAKVPVKDLANGWLVNTDITEIRDYYPLNQPGQYKVWFMRTILDH